MYYVKLKSCEIPLKSFPSYTYYALLMIARGGDIYCSNNKKNVTTFHVPFSILVKSLILLRSKSHSTINPVRFTVVSLVPVPVTGITDSVETKSNITRCLPLTKLLHKARAISNLH